MTVTTRPSRTTPTEEGGGLSIDNFGIYLLRDSQIKTQGRRRRRRSRNSGMRVIFMRITVQDNRSTLDGGGIYNSSSGDFTIQESTIQRNSAQDGGGLANLPDADLFVKRSLLLGNVARNPGLTEDGDPEEGGRGGGFFSMADGDAKSRTRRSPATRRPSAAAGSSTTRTARSGSRATRSGGTRRDRGAIGVVESDFVPEVPPQPNRALIARNTLIGGSLDGGSCDWYIDSEGGNLDTGGLRKEPEIPLEINLPMNTACFLNQPPTSNETIKDGRDRSATRSSTRSPTTAARRSRTASSASASRSTRRRPCPETDQRGVERRRTASATSAPSSTRARRRARQRGPRERVSDRADPGHDRDDGVHVQGHGRPDRRGGHPVRVPPARDRADGGPGADRPVGSDPARGAVDVLREPVVGAADGGGPLQVRAARIDRAGNVEETPRSSTSRGTTSRRRRRSSSRSRRS